jgi:multiple RNA-binding domain-containing protein 1
MIEELIQSKRKNKLLAQNPDLEKAQKQTIVKKAAVEEGEKAKKKKKKEMEKRVQVIEPANIVEVVYDDSAPQPEGQDEGQILEEKPLNEGQVLEEKPMTDLEWLRSRTSRTFGLVSDSEESDTEEKNDEKHECSDDEGDGGNQGPTPATPPATEPSDIEEEQPVAPKTSAAETKILKTGRLFVRNLVYGITEDDLRVVFSPFGQIEEVCPPYTSRGKADMCGT